MTNDQRRPQHRDSPKPQTQARKRRVIARYPKPARRDVRKKQR